MARMEKILEGMEWEAHSGKRFLPIVGSKKGRFLYVVAKAIGAKKALDLGTLTGYSALLLSQAVGAGGKVTSVEKDPHMLAEARDNFKKAGVKNVLLLEGDASHWIRKLRGPLDLILLDVWKEEYLPLLPYCVRLLRRGGVLVADNALWDTEGMKKFRAALDKTKALETVYVPIQDGMSFSVKK